MNKDDQNKTITKTGEPAGDGIKQQEGQEFDPVQAVKDLRENYVPKTDYEKVVKEKNDYFKALVNGDTIEKKEETPVDVKQLRKDLFSENSNLTNLEFTKKALELREELIETEGKDIFCPYGKHISPQDSDFIEAQKVADGLQHCVEVADGDPDIFRNELYRITVDSMPRSAINSRLKR